MINYPSAGWLNDYMASHKCDLETADQAWWDIEIEKGNPTPFDLDETAEAVSKEMRKGARAVDAYGKTHKRERKPNEVKRWVMERVAYWLTGCEDCGDVSEVVLSNPERTVDFVKDGKRYTLTLTEHRTPKG